MKRNTLLITLLGALCALSLNLKAATNTWTAGGGTTTTWTDTANWSAGALPAQTEHHCLCSLK